MKDITGSSGKYLVEDLLKQVPELAPALQEEAAFWGYERAEELGVDTAFGSVLAPKVVTLLCSPSWQHEPVLDNIFIFLELVAGLTDATALSAVDVSFAESLLVDPIAYERSKFYFGPNLRKAFKFISRRRAILPKRPLL